MLKNFTVASNDPSFPAFTFGSLCEPHIVSRAPYHTLLRRTKSPRTANPCVQPGQYVRSYPGANLPPPNISSAVACASTGNVGSVSQLLMSSGAFDLSKYACPALRCQRPAFPSTPNTKTPELTWRSAGICRRDGCETTVTFASPLSATRHAGGAPKQ